MTTGRINQITRIAAESPPEADAPKALPTSPPRRRTECISGRDARSARPPRQPRLTGKDANGHPIAPTKPLRTGPHADRPSPSLRQAGGWAALRHTALGRRDRTPWSRRRTAATLGAAPSRNLSFQAWPAAIRPQIPSAPGATRHPGFDHHGLHGPSPSGFGPRGPRRMSTPGTGIGPQGHTHSSPRKVLDQVWKIVSASFLTSTHTLRPLSEVCTPCMHKPRPKWLAGTEFSMGVVRARHFSHTKWATSEVPNPGPGGLGQIGFQVT